MKGAAARTLAVLLLLTLPAHAAERWQTLPPTPALPTPTQTGTVPIGTAKIWYATFGAGPPLILVHGGLANSNYFGLQIPALAAHYRVIAIDSRGHGRSTRGGARLGYDLMSDDVLAVMDSLGIKQAALVGWSDGAIIGLDIAIHHPDRLTALVAFAANSDPSGLKSEDSPTLNEGFARAQREYLTLSPDPSDWKAFVATLQRMWGHEPHFSDAQLRAIHVPTAIVDGDHDEAIRRDNTDHMAALIPGAEEIILPAASHYAFLQAPEDFNAAILAFLAKHPAP